MRARLACYPCTKILSDVPLEGYTLAESHTRSSSTASVVLRKFTGPEGETLWFLRASPNCAGCGKTVREAFEEAGFFFTFKQIPVDPASDLMESLFRVARAMGIPYSEYTFFSVVPVLRNFTVKVVEIRHAICRYQVYATSEEEALTKAAARETYLQNELNYTVQQVLPMPGTLSPLP